MLRHLLASSVAVLAISVSLPALAQSLSDSAYITQTNETGSLATQNQPGGQGNAAYITQSGGTTNTATQDAAPSVPPFTAAYATGGFQTITQTNNDSVVASQISTGVSGGQTITQTANRKNGTVKTTATQNFNSSAKGVGSQQTATQTNNAGASVTQSMNWGERNNTQVATQSGQTGSTISQTLYWTQQTNNSQSSSQSGTGTNNTQASEIVNGWDAGSRTTQSQVNGTSNSQYAGINQGLSSISQSQTGGVGNSQAGRVDTSGIGSLNNTLDQVQDQGVANVQTATVVHGNRNTAIQYQGIGGAGNTQTATFGTMTSQASMGLITQRQDNGSSAGTQIASQDSGTTNQIAQYQGNSNNYASATQSGGSGNLAIQNQGGIYFTASTGNVLNRTR
jgi:hypothetical protein